MAFPIVHSAILDLDEMEWPNTNTELDWSYRLTYCFLPDVLFCNVYFDKLTFFESDFCISNHDGTVLYPNSLEDNLKASYWTIKSFRDKSSGTKLQRSTRNTWQLTKHTWNRGINILNVLHFISCFTYIYFLGCTRTVRGYDKFLSDIYPGSVIAWYPSRWTWKL